MKILLLSAEPLRLRQASGTHITEIAAGLRAEGHEVTTCVTRAVGPYDHTSIFRRCAAYLVFCFQALRLLPRAEMIYARAHPGNLAIVIAAWLTGIPVIQEINGAYEDISITHGWLWPFMGIISSSYRIQYHKAAALIAVTSGLVEWARIQAPSVPVIEVANGVNCEIFHPSAVPIRAVERDYVVFFGSLTRWHGIEIMIDAIENSAWPADLDLVIIGEGQLGSVVSRAADRNPRIHALASMPQEKLRNVIAGAVIGLVPINSVGGRGKLGLSPLKLYEMLACGLPVVVTDFPGQAELVRSLQAGLVVSPDDPMALAKAVAELYRNPPSRGRMLGVASIMKAQHSWKNRVAAIDDLLRSTRPVTAPVT
jgi:glycosyltransferase involved in cell wall biosynthesis